MYFIGLGLLFIVMKLTEFGPVALWSWVAVLWPFGAALIWWWWADATGYTKRREMDKMDARREERRQKNMVALGTEDKSRRGRKR